VFKCSLLIASLVLFSSAPGYTWTNEKNFAEIVNSYRGYNSDELIRKWGSPNSSYNLNSGERVLTYVLEAGSSGSIVPILGAYSLSSSSLYCKVNFTLNSSSVITSSSFQGNSCRAKRSRLLKELAKAAKVQSLKNEKITPLK
jgi:hypothetical protein